MLRDLDLLGNANYARDRELGRKINLVEQMRMLETLRQMETDPAAATLPAGPPPKLPTGSRRRPPIESAIESANESEGGEVTC